ncbi:hypothetical protein [Phytohabitans kaempferiae]|uniref:Uncharacterized protein n=1 Tax=Phytohabitans kaempferiae TaxID=1620943 RepID=A0ABV6MC76_9ACTN
MDRRGFISTVGAASAAAATTAVVADPALAGPATAKAPKVDDRFLDTLTTINNLQVPGVLSGYENQIASGTSPRNLARNALRLVAAYANQRGAYYHQESLLPPVAALADALRARQNPSGLYDVGNLDSPPDTSFAMADIGLTYKLLEKDGSPTTVAIRDKYLAIMQKATDALVKGGVHTPNHRWEICKALSYIYDITKKKNVLARIDDWLGEGIDQDNEGEYSERSPNYASEVTNRSLVIVARLADRPKLRENVRQNLEMTLFRLQPNGEVETVHSRRQDQTGVQEVWKYWTHFREMAIVYNDRRFAAVAEQIGDQVAANPQSFASSGYSVGEFLAEALAYPDLAGELPRPAQLSTNYEKRTHNSHLVCIRRGDTTARIFGGTDYHNERRDSAGQETTIREIASGLSTNPTFFKFRKGAAILDSVRMSPSFFSTGHFRSNGLKPFQGGWRLTDTVKVPYHLPLPQKHRRGNGDYALTSEGRFYSKMDFANRPKQFKVLETKITIREVRPGVFEIEFEVNGPKTSLGIELAFRSGGTLDGVVGSGGAYQLVEGEGTYTVGDDVITFGPGNGPTSTSLGAGEKYTHLSGSLTPSGQRVYIGGSVPFRYLLRIG